jgi:transcriptional regulator with XRE-family HTH domain
MTPEHLAAWRKRLKLTQAQAANELGASLTAYRGWEGGKHHTPYYIALACYAVERDSDPKIVIKQLRKTIASITALVDSFERGLFPGCQQVEDRGDTEAKPTRIKKKSD